jgi:hypothetical protein
MSIFVVIRSGDRVPPSVVRRLRSAGQPEIKLGTWEKIQLATGIKQYGTAPLFGEVMQQYRMSKKGWEKAEWDKLPELVK